MTGQEFRDIRRRLGFTVRDWATVLGYTGSHSHVTIREYERGAKPIPRYIARLAYMFDWHGVPDEWWP